MRHLELLIDEARALSGNLRYDADSGVSQRTFRQFFQNAQDFVVREVVNSKCKYFLDTQTVTVVPSQAQYPYPSDLILLGIDSIQYSTDGRTWTDPLVRNIPKDKHNPYNGWAYGYILNRRAFELTPPVSTGYLLLTYNKKPKRLEKRSGKVTAVTGSPITSITLDMTYQSHDPNYLDQFDSITVIGKNGVTKIANMPITSVAAGTITVPSYALASGESITAGDFILAGGGTCNIPDFDDLVESFLILHATYQAKYGDSSQWSKAVQEDVSTHAKQVVAMFETLAEDIVQVPITNTDYLMID